MRETNKELIQILTALKSKQEKIEKTLNHKTFIHVHKSCEHMVRAVTLQNTCTCTCTVHVHAHVLYMYMCLYSHVHASV